MFSFFKSKPPSITDLSWLGVDIHSHLLPGIDDGAPDIPTSIRLIKELSDLGMKKFICTPHIFNDLYPNTPETINSALANVKQSLFKENINIELGAAAEYMIDHDFKITADLMCMPGQHILIEMSYLAESPNIEGIIFDLQIKGYVVILAHPERYNFYHKNLQRYQRLKDIGCLFQLNLLAISGYYGRDVKRIAEYLLQNKLYDLAATDLHHEKHLHALKQNVASGALYQLIGNYPFKNKQLFGE